MDTVMIPVTAKVPGVDRHAPIMIESGSIVASRMAALL